MQSYMLYTHICGRSKSFGPMCMITFPKLRQSSKSNALKILSSLWAHCTCSALFSATTLGMAELAHDLKQGNREAHRDCNIWHNPRNRLSCLGPVSLGTGHLEYNSILCPSPPVPRPSLTLCPNSVNVTCPSSTLYSTPGM